MVPRGARGEAEKRRQTSGPTLDDVRAMLDATTGDTEAETRDHAIILTLVCLGLRVSELCGLNLHETDLARGHTWIAGKWRKERELVSPGPLFRPAATAARVAMGAWRPAQRCASSVNSDSGVGLHVWPHGLRHTSITTALDVAGKAGIGMEKVGAHSRPQDVKSRRC
ncbi:MAG: tyrosine-type recombinase/integrase [Vicinamibacterales bacterium]